MSYSGTDFSPFGLIGRTEVRPTKTMTWQEVINNQSFRLKQARIRDEALNAEYLAMHVLGIWKRSELRDHLQKNILQEQELFFEKLVARRLSHEPLQHITRETEFYGLRLYTTPAALIPCPDTEILVEEVLREVVIFSESTLKILDIGTGSGAIALALSSKLPNASVIGIDISSDAIALAEKNKARLKLQNVSFEVIDVFNDSMEKKISHSIDILVSNPPYVSLKEFESLDTEVREFDPRIALTDEADGFIFYRRIAEIAPEILKVGGKIVVEVGYNGAEEVKQIFLTAGFTILRTVNDLQGIERVVVAKLQ